MNLPNKLTLTRILLVPVFMIFVSLGQYITPSYNPRYYLIAGLIFAVASFTDFLDGHLARKWNMVTVCSPVVLCIILAREFAVSGLRMVAAGAKDGKVIAANMWGKVKTVLQMLTIIFYYFTVSLTGNVLGQQCADIASVLCWVVAAVTAISGIKYLWDNRSFINTAK